MEELEQVFQLEELQDFLANHEMVLVYISRPNCGVCVSLLPKVQELVRDFPRLRAVHVDLADVPEIAGAFTLLAAPAILLMVEGKEILRKAGIISIDLFTKELQKIYTAYYH